MVKALERLDGELDLRRMHRIVVAKDFAGELAELSAATASGDPITHTDEGYAVAVAKVMVLPRGEDYEIVPVISAHYESATGRVYESTWKFNPLLFKGRGYIRRYGMHDLAKAVKAMSDDFHKVAGPGFGELRVSTKTERRREAERFEAIMEAEEQRSEDSQPEG